MFDYIDQPACCLRPVLLQLQKHPLNLRWIERVCGFVSDPRMHRRARYTLAPRRHVVRMPRTAPRLGRGVFLQDFLACPREASSFASAQTFETALRDFLQHRIDFFAHQLRDGHAPVTLPSFAPFLQKALKDRWRNKAEQMRIDPTGSTTADPGAVSNHWSAIDAQ